MNHTKENQNIAVKPPGKDAEETSPQRDAAARFFNLGFSRDFVNPGFQLNLHLGHHLRLDPSSTLTICETQPPASIALWGSCNGEIRIGICHFRAHFKQK